MHCTQALQMQLLCAHGGRNLHCCLGLRTARCCQRHQRMHADNRQPCLLWLPAGPRCAALTDRPLCCQPALQLSRCESAGQADPVRSSAPGVRPLVLNSIYFQCTMRFSQQLFTITCISKHSIKIKSIFCTFAFHTSQISIYKKWHCNSIFLLCECGNIIIMYPILMLIPLTFGQFVVRVYRKFETVLRKYVYEL